MEHSSTLGQLALYAAMVAGLCAVMLGLSYVLGQRTKQTAARDDAYESGVISTGGARYRMSAKFYLIAMFFVVFDLEAVYVLAWGVSAREAGWAGYIEMMVFLFILLAGLVYLWRCGALNWAPQRQQSSHRRY